MSALLLCSDLLLQSQVTAAAERAGVEMAVAANADALVERATTLRPRLVVVDLAEPGIDPRSLIERLAPLLPDGATCLAFGPHVHKARLAAAAEAGFGQVLSRGQFHAQMEDLLRQLAAETS